MTTVRDVQANTELRFDSSANSTRHLISMLFFLSGLTGLSYEVIWFKQFSHVWGASTLAMAPVVGVFLIGLGFGAWIGGMASERVRNPLLCYGTLEVGIGILALVIPWETSALWRLSVHLYAHVRDNPMLYGLVRCATTFIVIGPATILMGSTLPMLVKHLATSDRLGRATSWLYGINTLGAAVGCYLVGFQLLPAIGLIWTNLGSGVLNVGVGCVAIATGTIFQPRFVDAVQVRPELQGSINRSQCTQQSLLIYAATIISGCAGLILQTVWSRQLALVVGGSTYAFSATLLVILLGIGLGSVLFRNTVPSTVDRHSAVLYVAAATILSIVFGISLIGIAADFTAVAIPLRHNYASNALVCIVASALVEFCAALSMGVLFPSFVQCLDSTGTAPGRAVGNVYLCNSVGAFVGASMTSAWLIPNWGTHGAASVGLLLYLGVVILMTMTITPTLRRCAAFCISALVAANYLNSNEDPRRANLGMYLYGYQRPDARLPDLLFFREGVACNVLVTRDDGQISLRVNGKVDGGTGSDMAMQLGLAYLPRFLNPAASNVLVIGFGTGVTSGGSLLFPNTNVTCCEIEPSVISAAALFSAVNHKPHESEHFRVIYDDARAFVQGTDEQYDLILSEPSNPWIAGVANLFSEEFYRSASRKLARNGILGQWIQTYSFSNSEYAMVVQAVQSIFPHYRLLRISKGDTILLASNDSLDRDGVLLSMSQSIVDASPQIRGDLQRYFSSTKVSELLLTRLVLDESGLRDFVETEGHGLRNRDSDLKLEFLAARRLYDYTRNNAASGLLAHSRAEWFVRHFRQLGCDMKHVDSLHQIAMLLLNEGHCDVAADVIGFGLEVAPASLTLIVDQMMASNRLSGSDAATLHDREAISAADLNRLAVRLWGQRRYTDAATVYEILVSRYPQSATSWTNLAVNYDLNGDRDEAASAHRRAIELDPVNDFSVTESEKFRESEKSMNGLERHR